VKKVLVITYYWPPSGGAGVQRWLKFVKYLRLYGWEPVVYTPSNPELPVTDNSLLNEIPDGLTVLKHPLWEPYQLYKRFSGRSENINTGFLTEKGVTGWKEKLSVWVRGNFFIPDARKFWIKPSVKFLSGYLEKNQIHAIVSSGPPHSMHLIALSLKKKFNLPWLADFRDPWTGIDYYNDLMLTGYADRKHHKMEQEVLQKADAIVSVGYDMSRNFEKVLGQRKSKFHIITNGYDESDFRVNTPQLSRKFRLLHAGTLVRSRNPVVLWKVLSELVKESAEFKNQLEIVLTGKVDAEVSESLLAAGLDPFIVRTGYVSHQEAINLMFSAQVLLLILNDAPNAKGILTGKLFEYLAVKRPVICIGPEDGDAATIISDTNAGFIAAFKDEQKIKMIISECFHLFCQGKLESHSRHTEVFSRKELTHKLAELLNQMID